MSSLDGVIVCFSFIVCENQHKTAFVFNVCIIKYFNRYQLKEIQQTNPLFVFKDNVYYIGRLLTLKHV